jgi:uncharacterized delta-60 repeat protein
MAGEARKEWTQLETVTSVADSGEDITTGSDGSIYITGSTYKSQYRDAFIRKYNSDGSKEWAKLLGSPEDCVGYSITTGPDGSIYIAGYVATPGNLNRKTNKFVQSDAFIAKYDSDGSKVWKKLLGSSSSTYGGYDITTGSDGSVYITGATERRGGIDTDAFIAKYNSDGSKAWTQELSSKSSFTIGGDYASESGNSITIGSDGSIYITGSTAGHLDGNINSMRSDHSDAFIAKYNSDGSKAWTQLLGSSIYGGYYGKGEGITTGSDGSIYITGTIGSNLDGNRNRVSANAFLAKYKSDGSKVWTQILGSSEEDLGVC